jgi:lipid A 3-O-deacylase
MAGGYAIGDGDDLGSDVQFRSRLGIRRPIRPLWRLGLAIEHKSNGGIGDINPGVETLYITLGRAF